jgi:hypothetical protein
MGKPDFSLIILAADGRMPSVLSLKHAMQKGGSAVPLRLSIVGDSSITFVEVSEFDPIAGDESDDHGTDPKPVKPQNNTGDVGSVQ